MKDHPPHTPGYTGVLAELGTRFDLAASCGWDAGLGCFIAEAYRAGQLVYRASAPTDLEALAGLAAELEQ